ncbi:conjugative transfer domain protein [Orientia chuto str. Dubai]|uniref:Conjugative transfer domain protein n=1 Tax=Orientia chuto str. Dubai TaxID=1359168 RepID=A0A0F3MH92_9RICK|nr:hypothetical protein [Candidatus Orientia mediorientalis]KJV54852.1 conjugative transfer domain protein [Orientia chuto str. Dubai]
MNWHAVYKFIFLLFAIAYQVSKAATINDYGTRGHTFPIIEESLLYVIIAKLNSAAKSGLLKEM